MNKSERPTPVQRSPEPPTIQDDEIRLLAYQFYIEGGKHDGNDLEHWLKAKRQLEQRDKQATAA